MEEIRELPHDDQIARLDQILDALTLRYGIRTVGRTLLQYENNAVYQIDVPDSAPLVARIATPWGRSADEQRSEARWLETLTKRGGLAVPEPVPNLDGALATLIEFEDAAEVYPCVVLRYVPGDLPEPGISPMFLERLGAFTAELHRQAERFVPPAGFVRPRWDWERLFGDQSILRDESAVAALAPAQRRVLDAAGERIWRALTTFKDHGLGQGLIHGDLHRDNILICNGEVGVIDFDDCGFGYFLYDLASVLDSFQRRVAAGPEDYGRQRTALLDGYRRVRPLPDELDQQLAIFMAMRDMVTLDFILGSKNANVRTWGPPRIAGIIEQLQGRLDGIRSLAV